MRLGDGFLLRASQRSRKKSAGKMTGRKAAVVMTKEATERSVVRW